MTIFERIIGENIFIDFWKQIQQYVFTEGRFRQLITLQPIEIYKADTEMEFDTAKVQLSISSTVENLVQRRIERTINFLTLNLEENQKNLASYDFDVTVNAFMPYVEINKFFNHHFANQTYEIEEKKYYLHIKQFLFNNDGDKAVLHLPFILESKRWFWKRKMHGSALLTGYIIYHQPKDMVKIKDLSYQLETQSMVLNTVDTLYHDHIIEFLTDFLQYNFKDDLFHARTQAQEEINSYQEQNNWVNGIINTLELEKVSLHPDGVRGLFLANGKLHLIR